MPTIRVKVLTRDLRFRQIIEDAINAKVIIYIPQWNAQTVTIRTDDPITREEVIEAIGVDYLEYVDTIEVFDQKESRMEFSKDFEPSFTTADNLLKKD